MTDHRLRRQQIVITSIKPVKKRRQQPDAHDVRGLAIFFFYPVEHKRRSIYCVSRLYFKVQTETHFKTL